jgi:PAS domain S-box-containing protein
MNSAAQREGPSAGALGLALAALLSVAVLAHDVGLLPDDWFVALRQPSAAGLALLVLGFACARSRQRAAALFAFAGAAASESVALTAAFEAGGLLAAVPVAALALLAAGAAIHELPAPRRVRSTVLLTVSPICLVLSVVALIWPSPLIGPAAWLSSGAAAASLLAIELALRDGEANGRHKIPWLIAPIAVAGGVSAAAAAWLVIELSSLPAAETHFAAVLIATTLALLTCAIVGIVSNGARAATFEGLVHKQKRAIATRRTVMRERARSLRQIRHRYEELFANVPAPVVLTEPSGLVLAANPALMRLLGASSESQIKHRNFADFYANPNDRRRLVDDWVSSGVDLHSGEVTLKRLDGDFVQVLYSLRLVRGPDRAVDYIQGTLTDITALRKAETNRQALEANLRMSQKLESVGRLAAGIAHEINTPMQYIGDNVYFLKGAFASLHEQHTQRATVLDQPDDAERKIRLLREIETSADADSTWEQIPGAIERSQEGIGTVSRIVAAMKELAHPGQGTKVATDLNAIVGTALTVTRNEYKTVAAVETQLSPMPEVVAYRNELCQVLINLIVNASHAIQDNHKPGDSLGRIVVRTWHDAEWACVDVEDNGCGIPDAVRDKIFDPFFTTKEVGKGTGQGLALARSTVVDKHGGEIGLRSRVGGGTTFTIKLPRKQLDSSFEATSREVQS